MTAVDLDRIKSKLGLEELREALAGPVVVIQRPGDEEPARVPASLAQLEMLQGIQNLLINISYAVDAIARHIVPVQDLPMEVEDAEVPDSEEGNGGLRSVPDPAADDGDAEA